ncbi:hypothetical protein KSC_005810 [Ktedonobacter sp. SOSP1-52]|uniref:transposase n=1 Tax=Ktedonobacter sp. SOSP1-52 TaxID=2778366 RepID=UPI00191628F0|nr:transposase [Ktedonobacter sp. SOSP1-52]GHO61689.1 hypothetical protein KSC_005810 [Ktedonobacter sp. SOSP1-52]
MQQALPFRAVVADSFYGEDRGFRSGLADLQVPYVLALKPSHAWWHPEEEAGTLQDVAHEAGWKGSKHPGKWVCVCRTFRDGRQEDWWALEIVAGPFGPDQKERAMVVATDPQQLPDTTTSYLVTNLPASSETEASWPAATLEEVMRLYGLRMWIEQSYKHVKHALGWSQYQVRSDTAIRRHWQLVCCAFSFCWYHLSHPAVCTAQAFSQPPEPATAPTTSTSAAPADAGKKITTAHERRPQVSWPAALRVVRGWLEPWIMLRRYWSGWSSLPPPPAVQRLFQGLERGQGLALYSSA